jgi:seryl-tRNA synthetase
MKQQVASSKAAIQQLNDELATAEKHLQEELIKLPNLPHASVKQGRSAEENEIMREGGIKPTLGPDALPHWELIKKYSLVDFEIGAKLTGSGFPVYKVKAPNYRGR